jgi:DNA repair protein RadA/Sms
MGEVDRVLGSGLIPGSVVLLGGAPGIGKSTLVLQVGGALARRSGRVLYASGEESIGQIAARAERLGVSHERLLLLTQTRVEAILEAAREEPLAALVVDSIQTVYTSSQEGLPGNLTQIRSVTGHLLGFAKREGVPVIVVGHVTKDGQLAGPRLLEHMVDVVLAFEGDEEHATRLLRATKNRFGSTEELGVFEMGGEGLREIQNPSEVFLRQRPADSVGSCITASLQGSRPLLLEVQALLSPCTGGNPRRTCVGVDSSRLAMLLAVLDRHADLFVLDHDVFANVAGGLRLREPAADLAVLLAVASSHTRRPISAGTIAIGEVGLTGELRQVPRMEMRLAEAARLGLSRVILPAGGKAASKAPDSLDVVAVPDVRAAVENAF